jgi:hypothetical protein
LNYLISFSVRTKKEKVSQPLQVRQYGFIKKAEKALPQAAFSKNPVISFSVLRAKSVTVVDTISTTVIFYFPPSEEWFLRKAGLFPNISVHRRDARPDLLRP